MKIRTLFRKQYWRIIKLFYDNKNGQLHLREMSRMLNLRESALSRHLNALLREDILIAHSLGNMKFFRVKDASKVFFLFDIYRFEELPLLRKNAVRIYIEKLPSRPVFVIIFGSTAKGVFKNESDLDIISVFDKPIDTKAASRYAESQTGIKVSNIIMSFSDFVKEIRLKEDKVVQSAIETGIVAYNHAYYYEVIKNEGYDPKKDDRGQGVSSEKD